MNFIEQIVDYVVRPQRENYDIRRLGPKIIDLVSKKSGKNISCVREDEIIVNDKKQKLHLSFYFNPHAYSDNCVVYLHANNGSRIEVLPYLRMILEQDTNVCIFDFSGSGISDGNYVTLGINEAEDVQCVIKHLKAKKNVENVVLWGRSMGAVAAIIYTSRTNELIRGLILDSPFKDLHKLIKEIASQITGLPKMFFDPLLYFVNNLIKEKAGITLQNLKIKKYLTSGHFSKVPALFLTSRSDKLVGSHHGEKLFKRYKCERKVLKYIELEHHENRDGKLISYCMEFANECFNTKKEKASLSKYNQAYMRMDSKECYLMDNGNRDRIKTEYVSLSSQRIQRNNSNTTLDFSDKLSLSQFKHYHYSNDHSEIYSYSKSNSFFRPPKRQQLQYSLYIDQTKNKKKQ